ncbi:MULTISPECIES: DUF2059 domain-containing protein [unclassified Moraxella]|uniref:DUF2059 domain-containing protein n=1 Tax=unclassified Moraxella TaxID=2685852 RepID=UPI003AF91B54
MKFSKIALLTSIIAIMPLSQVAQADIILPQTTKLATQTVSQMPSIESLEKLLTVMQFDKSLDEMNQQSVAMVEDMMKKAFAQMPKDNKLTDEQNQQMQQAVQQFTQELISEQNTPAMRQQFKNAYIESAKVVYNQQEVDAMLAFYSSPMGQQIVAKQTQFNIKNMQQVMAITQQSQQRLMTTKLPVLMEKIEKITKSTQKTTKTVKHKTGKK